MKVALQKLHRAEIIKLLRSSKKNTGFRLDLVYNHSLDPILKTAVMVKPHLKAAQRNRVKRLVRQSFIDLAPRIIRGGNCIAIVKKTPAAGDIKIQLQLESLLKQVKFI